MKFSYGDIVYSINTNGVRKYRVVKLWDTLISKDYGIEYPVYLVRDVKTKVMTPLIECKLYKDKKMAKREYKEALRHFKRGVKFSDWRALYKYEN